MNLDLFTIKNTPIRKTKWIIPGVMESGRYHLIYGDKGAGKTTFTCGYLIPEAMDGGIERIVYISPGEETTAADLLVYAAVHGYDPSQVLYFSDGVEMSFAAGTGDEIDESSGVPQFTGEGKERENELIRLNMHPEALTDKNNVNSRNKSFYFPVDVLALMKNIRDDVPTLYIVEGLDEVVGADVLRSYGGTDTVQNRSWKNVIRYIENLLSDNDVFIDVTHTKKGDGSQIKGSTGRFDKARHALRINGHNKTGERYTTVVGEGNATGREWRNEQIILVRDVEEQDIQKAFGHPVTHRVPQKVFSGLESVATDMTLPDLLTLDWSEPRSTADIVVALGLREENGIKANDARMWEKARKNLPANVRISSVKRGLWSWENWAEFQDEDDAA
ncbi:AAA family ATPase [Ornithinimicrobium cerasi]|uniref:AAA family ATPase n=1 Tax=Ornithinimicrobium cerasi TaxID=2248773 RepID=UPI000EFF3F40|nr:AAA family ATPase [Ornithinimicrobium cerasi]